MTITKKWNRMEAFTFRNLNKIKDYLLYTRNYVNYATKIMLEIMRELKISL